MDLSHILQLIGGIGLFLYGMKYLGASLERLAGAKLEKTLEKLTGKSVNINIIEVRRPELDAQLTAESIASACPQAIQEQRWIM